MEVPHAVLSPALHTSPWAVSLNLLGAPSNHPTEFPPFYAVPAPTVRASDKRFYFGSTDAGHRISLEGIPESYLDVGVREGGPTSRAYAWSPGAGEWDKAGRWVVRWVSPFSGSQEIHSTSPSLPPAVVQEFARHTAGGGGPMNTFWSLFIGDEPRHALGVARRASNRSEVVLLALESGRAPVELRRADGEPFTDLEGAMRAEGHWYVTTSPTDMWSSIVWKVDGAIARELARIPRAGMAGRPGGARLAWRADSPSVGLVVDGQPAGDRPVPLRWVVPINPESGTTRGPELLGGADLGDQTVTACADDNSGWVMDVPWAVTARITNGAAEGTLSGAVYARIHMTRGKTCVEKISGALDSASAKGVLATVGPRASRLLGPNVTVSALTGGTRHPLRCVLPEIR